MRYGLLAASVLLLLPAVESVACSARQWQPEDLVENEPVYSANGRYCAVARWYDVPDFGGERAGKVFHLDPEYEGEEHSSRAFSERVIVAWYEVTEAGHRRIAELPVPRRMDEVLVADSGQYLVAVRRIHGGSCSGSLELTDPVVAVYRSDGSSDSLTAN